MKVLLCNDTGTKSHIGCQAVSDAHARLLGRAGHKVVHRYFVNDLRSFARDSVAETCQALERSETLAADLAEVDAVIVNGEGTLHHGNGVEYIALLALGQRLGKATLLVNALYQDMDFDPETLRRLNAFYVRDPRSAAYVQSLGVDCTEAPDSFVAAAFLDTPREVFDGATLVTDWVKARDEDVGEACTALLLGAPRDRPDYFYPLQSETAPATWAHAVADVASAGAVVSARYHGLYLATLAGTPFVPLGSNSWKMEAFMEAHDLPFRPSSDIATLVARLAELDDHRPAFAVARARLLERRDLPIFDGLGRGDESDEDAEVETLRRDIADRADALSTEAMAMAKRRMREAEMRIALLSGRGAMRRGAVGRLVDRLRR